jgi:pilus assembly protein CpaE
MVSGGPMEGKIVTIYSPKGGTGCTTVAINLAVSLQNEETPVVIVDGNLQFGDIAVFLNEQARNNVADLAPRADELDPEVVEEVVINHAPSGVHILPAPTRPEEAEGVTGDQFSKLLTYLRKLYSYVIVDTTSSLTDVTLAAIDTSDLIILLTNQVIPAIKNARLFLDLADVLSIDRRRIIFIMNRYDKRIGITPDKVGESFKQDIVAVLPSDSRTVIPSVNRGRPFMLDDKSRPVARAMLVLTEKMRERLTELAKTDAEQEEEAGVGISLGRLIKH